MSETRFLTIVSDEGGYIMARGYLKGYFDGTTGAIQLSGSLPIQLGGVIAKVVVLDNRDDHDGVLLELTKGFRLYGKHMLYGDTINFA